MYVCIYVLEYIRKCLYLLFYIIYKYLLIDTYKLRI